MPTLITYLLIVITLVLIVVIDEKLLNNDFLGKLN